MQIFIAVVLIFAVFQSNLKILLLPRIYGIIFAVTSGLLCLLLGNNTASSSIIEEFAKYNTLGFLQNWCVVLLIQEFAATIAGAKLLQAKSENSKLKVIYFFAFFPSVLIIAGVFYLKLVTYNQFLEIDFQVINYLLAIICPALLLFSGEIIRFLARKNNNLLIEAIMQSELLLLLAGIFIPVIAQAELYRANAIESDIILTLKLFIYLGIFVITSAFVSILWNKLKIKLSNK